MTVKELIFKLEQIEDKDTIVGMIARADRDGPGGIYEYTGVKITSSYMYDWEERLLVNNIKVVVFE